MTCIIHGVNTKKDLKDKVKNKEYEDIFVQDPSVFNPWGPVRIDRAPERRFVVTNHPKRTWFTQVEITETGIKVS
jgi:hypothetical protein